MTHTELSNLLTGADNGSTVLYHKNTFLKFRSEFLSGDMFLQIK